MSKFDVIVVGAGVYGLCIAAEASSLGLGVLVLDSRINPNEDNASLGETRLSRLTTVEDAKYACLARESQGYFAELQEGSANPLFRETGFAFVAEPGSLHQRHHSGSNVYELACGLAKAESIIFEAHSGLDFNVLFPSLSVDRESRVFYEPGAWTLYVDHIQSAMLKRCAKRGVEIQFGTTALEIVEARDSVKVYTSPHIALSAAQVIVASGAAPVGLLPSARVFPQPVVWTGMVDSSVFPAVVVTRPNRDLLFGFAPSDVYRDAKFVLENVNWRRRDAKSQAFLDLQSVVVREARNLVPGVTSPTRAAHCNYVVMPGSRMTVSTQGRHRVLYVNCCSGHGYKLAPAIAVRVAQALRDRDLASAAMS